MWLPAIGEVIKDVDVAKGEIIVTLLPGLREVYETNGNSEEDVYDEDNADGEEGEE